jgi:hypothetical protein
MTKASLSLTVCLAISALFYSCKKKAIDCPVIDYSNYSKTSMERFGRVVIELRDNQGRDLLNPATPGHYDIALIKALNNFPIFVIDVNQNEFMGNKDRVRLHMYFENTTTPIKLKLSNTVTDNITPRYLHPDYGCGSVQTLASISYNNVFYKPWDEQLRYFIITKKS